MTTSNEPRKLPTRPGWWWVKLARNLAPEVVRVNLLGADLYVSGWANSRVDERRDIEWLAEIPGPAVLAALAEWAEAHELDCTEAGHQDRFWDAEIALADTIRAERDGAA